MSVQFRSLVNEVMNDADYNSRVARDELIKRSVRDKELRDELLRLGADQMIRSYHTDQRHASEAPSEPQKYEPRETPETPEKQERREKSAERRLFWDRYALYGHKPLKIAGKADLTESERARRVQAAGNIRCADFEAAVNTALPKGKLVGQFYAIDKIIKIAKEHDVIPARK
jgi:hypothetical protein